MEGSRARSEPAAANCSNKSATWRWWMRFFAACQARTTLNEAHSATLQARGLHSVQGQIEQWLVAGPIRAQYCAQRRSLMASHGQRFPLPVRKPPSQSLSGFAFQAGHANSILDVALRPPAVASRLRSLTVASPRPSRVRPSRLPECPGDVSQVATLTRRAQDPI
jgi:hypothetical protein